MAEPDNTHVAWGIGILNRKPLLVHIFFSYGSPFPFIESLSQGLGPSPALVFVSNPWSILSRWKNDQHLVPIFHGAESTFQSYLQDYRSHRRRYPHHRVVTLANDTMEREFLHAHGIEVVLFQHNGFLHAYEQPRIAEKEFDAVYIARLHPVKRVELARDIPSCCIVFRTVEREYFQQIRPLVSHFVFANGDPLSDQSTWLPRAQVADWCARSRTGLCLSAEEGAMYASAEYMLWGLPVVSTHSIGGRDEYFDDRYCVICEDNPASIASAVKEAISRNFEPNVIRSTFLAKVMERRAGLLRFIIDRTAGWEGTLEPFVRDWLNIATPFLDNNESPAGEWWFTAPQLLEALDSVQLCAGPRSKARGFVMPKASGLFQDVAAIDRASVTAALGQIVDPDLEQIVQTEGFGYGETGYFDRAESWADEEWARAQRFLAPHAIDYANTLDLACGRGRHSQMLATLAKHMVLVEVNPEYIAFCRERFAGKPWDFVVNNGYDLAAVGDRSITFLYCYDAAVHFDLEIILAYIKEFRRVLVPGGFAFVHHSNVDAHPGIDFRLHPHWRNFMSKEIFAHLAIHNGLELIDQLVFDGCGPEAASDCFSLVRLNANAEMPASRSRAEVLREVSAARNKIERLQKEVTTLSQSLAAIRASRSWHLTAPLRLIVDTVRGR